MRFWNWLVSWFKPAEVAGSESIKLGGAAPLPERVIRIHPAVECYLDRFRHIRATEPLPNRLGLGEDWYVTLVLADTKAEADYWIGELGLERAKYVDNMDAILGVSRDVGVVAAVGPLRRSDTVARYHELRECGFRVYRVLSDGMTPGRGQ